MNSAEREHAGAIADEPDAMGFYGKLPSRGDFLARRVPDGFMGPWDAWLQDCLSELKATLGERWLEVYLTSPAWRFVCAPGACGDRAVAGVLVPSVDSVGRYFPLTIVTAVSHALSPLAAAAALEEVLTAAEALAVEALADDSLELDAFDERIRALGARVTRLRPASPIKYGTPGAPVLQEGAVGQWSFPIPSQADLQVAMLEMTSQRLGELYAPLVVWWSRGSQMVEPSGLVTQGLPAPASFAAMLDGGWDSRGWGVLPAVVSADTTEPPTDPPTGAGGLTPPHYRSAAISHRGLRREANQDSYLQRPEAGLWVVADGVGGHDEGDVASRMVCDTLSDFQPVASFEELIESARGRLHEVNDYLNRAASRPVNPVVSGSTVVALMARGSRCAVLWAGDSRVYRWRAGRLEQLTRDHSVEDADETAIESHALTRAVGAESGFALDTFRDRVRAGDRFLLCSDGLTRVVQDQQIAERLGADDIDLAVKNLVDDTLAAGAPDNITALIVEAFVPPPAV